MSEVVAGSSFFPTFVDQLPVTKAAVAYAEQMHRGQERGDGGAFIQHPLEVASMLHDVGAPDHLVAAGVLHDLVEKTEVTASDLKARFGPRITALVISVSDDDRIRDYASRKAALRRQVAGAGHEALGLFAADKVSKLRELRREMTSVDEPGAAAKGRLPRARRLRHYQRSLALLEERLPESPLVRDMRHELRLVLAHRATPARAG